MNKVYININGQKLEVDLENNSTVSAFTKMLFGVIKTGL